MATFTSNNQSGRYLQLTITETVNTPGNTSTLNWTLTSAGGASAYYTIGKTTIVISGQTVYEKAQTDWEDRVFPAAKGSVSGSLVVQHDVNGKKTIEVSFKTRVYIFEPLEYGGEMKLTDIDRTAPSVTCSVSNITSAGFTISGSSSVTADKWWFSLDDGVNWTEYSATAGTSANKAVSGLSPNTTYKVKVRARKKSNQVNGTSAVVNAKTLGASVIVKTYDFAADANSAVMKFNLTVYDSSYYHRLTVKDVNTTLFTISLGKYAAGTADRSVTLTADQRNAILSAMPSSKTKKFNILIATFKESSFVNLIGSESVKQITATTSENLSKPTFPGFSYSDIRQIVVDVTGNNQVLVQGFSSLRVVCEGGTAKNGASISGYSASIGDSSKSSSGRTLDIGAISSKGNLKLVVTCTDSRGYAQSIEKTVTVLPYTKPKVSNFKLRRMNEIGGLIQLSFSGSISAIKADGTTNTNAVVDATYWYKRTDEEEWSEAISILEDVSSNGTSFSFASLELIELDPESSYDFWMRIQDKLYGYSMLDITVVLQKGTPIVAIRKRDSAHSFPRVGINNPNPQYPLDVNGEIAMLGQIVMGYRGTLSGQGFNTLKSGGIWFYSGNGASANAPADTPGFLEVITDGTNVVHRFTCIAAGHAVYVRAFSPDKNTWTAWAAK